MSVPKASDSLWQSFLEGSRFFMGQGPIHETLRSLAQTLDHEGIDYALVGGMALVAHGYRRFTEDIDLLLTPESLEHFRERCLGRGYLPAFPGATKTFKDTQTGVRIEMLTTGEYPGDGKPKSVRFPDPHDVAFEREGLKIIRLEPLIELKLASGLSAPHRLKDLSDVQDLIQKLDLSLELAERLDPSVRDEYRRLWHTVRGA
jgi:hypothetical protein